MKNVMLATLSAVLMGGVALAQTSAPATNPSSPPMAPAANPGAPAAPATTQPARPANPATSANPATTGSVSANRTAMTELTKPMLGTHMWKQAVYDANENRIGEIDNLVIDRDGKITQVVVGVGGFLGLGEKMVSFNYSELKPMVRNGNLWFMVNMTKDQMTAAPAFETSSYTY